MKPHYSSLEILEARIAPASVTTGAAATTTTTTTPLLAHAVVITATLGAPVLVTAGELLTTAGASSGSYLLYVEQGAALVFTTDLNNNRQVDFNEITGIAAGNGLEMICFTDIHGDIVTNLQQTNVFYPGKGEATVYTLSNSNPSAAGINPAVGGDGRVLLDNTINLIEMRALETTDVVNPADAVTHQAPTTCSIFGDIIAGGGFGLPNGTGGLIVDDTAALQTNTNFGQPINPTVGGIMIGSAVNGVNGVPGMFFSFGASNLGTDVTGNFLPFSPARGEAGGSINGVHTIGSTTLNIGLIQAGNGGVGGNGGSVENVTFASNNGGGYQVIAGNGGDGPVGGAGGSILNFSDTGSVTGQVQILTGNGGTGLTGAGGSGGSFTFETFNIYGNIAVNLGSGGNGFTAGGNGAGLAKGLFTQPMNTVGAPGGDSAGTTHIDSANYVGPTAGSSYGTYASQDIGTQTPIDFAELLPGEAPLIHNLPQNAVFPNAPANAGDYVFTTVGTSQIVVAFGDGNGGIASSVDKGGQIVYDEIALSGVYDPSAIAVADVNGDGHPDIIVGSGDAGSEMGIAVYLSQYNAQGQFVGFSQPIYSPLPQLSSGDAANYAALGHVSSPSQILAIVPGDYAGAGGVFPGVNPNNPNLKPATGTTQLAVIETQYLGQTIKNGEVSALSDPVTTAIFLTPSIEYNYVTNTMGMTGQFFADFGSKGSVVGNVVSGALPKLPVVDIGGAIASASPLFVGQGHDVLFYAGAGAQAVNTLDYSNQNQYLGGQDPAPVVNGKTFFLGYVDTDRQLGLNYITLENFQLQAFTVTDLNLGPYSAAGNGPGTGYGTADIIAVSKDRYVVAVQGDDTGFGDQISGGDQTAANNVTVGQGDNAGFYLGASVGGVGGADLLTGGNVYGIVSGYFTATKANGGTANTVMILSDGNGGGTEVDEVTITSGPQGGAVDGTLLHILNIPGVPAPTTTPLSFDVLYPSITNTTNAVPVSAALDGSSNLYIGLYGFTGDFGLVLSTQNVGLELSAGNGGNSFIGVGGSGGAFGGGSLTKTVTKTSGSTTVNLGAYEGALNFVYSGDFFLQAGNGGSGFTGGGAGGSVAAVNVVYAQTSNDSGLGVIIFAGNGGNGVSGPGGAGGSLTQNELQAQLQQATATVDPASYEDEIYLFAGFGGNGATGGVGGSVIGNGVTPDATTNDLYINLPIYAPGSPQPGWGGNGLHQGGAGGSIDNFLTDLQQEVNIVGVPPIGEFYLYAGNGGSAVSGPGGAGGSVLNSSPQKNAYLDGTFSITAGDGAMGLSGGAGGNITNVILSNVQNSQPSGVYVAAGFGGNGTSGNGGAGGSVSTVTVQSTGASPVELFPSGTFANFNSVFAGDGGNSAGAAGGAGGSVTGVLSASSDGAYAVAAGAGGDGLTHGGAGGSVISTDISLGSSTHSKALVIAGAGGDASAFIPNPNDQTPDQAEDAFGGQIGVGGNGGSIRGFTQAGSTGAHSDLIAGNGGSSLNYGTIFDATSHVGTGGSVTNTDVTGAYGNVAPNVPIASYNNYLAGQTVAQFVDVELRTGVGALTDAGGFGGGGNVGIVVGVSGHIKDELNQPVNEPTVESPEPASGAIDGSLINIVGRNLLAAVAGSVDQIAKIQLAENIEIPNGIIGAQKEEYNQDGTPIYEVNPKTGQTVYEEYSNGTLILDPNGNPIPVPVVGYGYITVLGQIDPNPTLAALGASGAPSLDGALEAGAIVLASPAENALGQQVTLPGAVFVL